MLQQLTSALWVALAVCVSAAAAGLVDLVDTRIGTGGVGYGDGSLNPGAQVPFGAMRLGPDTTWVPVAGGQQVWLEFDHFGGYHFNDTHIRCFSHMHTVGAGPCSPGPPKPTDKPASTKADQG